MKSNNSRVVGSREITSRNLQVSRQALPQLTAENSLTLFSLSLSSQCSPKITMLRENGF
jgi:hypothetical protein